MFLRRLIITLPFIFFTIIVLFSLYFGSFFIFPNVSALAEQKPGTTALMKFRMRQWEHTGKKRSIDQRWIPYHRISSYLINAVIISEDAKFWQHEGFDFKAIQAAIEKDLKTRTFKLGASTITQQLVKNLFLSPSKNPIRKIKEAILTWRIENALSKQRILELYLNVIEWGDGIFGSEAAARCYYQTSAADLTARQAATLAAILPNPIKYRPMSPNQFVIRRSDAIYRIMIKQGIVVETTETESISDDSTVSSDTARTPQMHIDDLIDSLSKLDKSTESRFADSL
jgi:monofunctional glycosyltransferase